MRISPALPLAQALRLYEKTAEYLLCFLRFANSLPSLPWSEDSMDNAIAWCRRAVCMLGPNSLVRTIDYGRRQKFLHALETARNLPFPERERFLNCMAENLGAELVLSPPKALPFPKARKSGKFLVFFHDQMLFVAGRTSQAAPA